MGATPDISAPPEPALRKGWWFRRIVFGVVCVLLILLATRFVTLWWTDRQIDRLFAELQSEGLPARFEHLAPPSVPDEQNAGLVWQQAFDLVDQTVDSPKTSDFDWDQLGRYPPFKVLWHQLVAHNERANGPAMAVALKAAKLPKANWGTEYVSGKFGSTSTLNRSRDLANRLSDSAAADFIRHEPAKGVEKINAVFKLAADIRVDRTLVAQLVGQGIDALACATMREHVRTLQIGDGPHQVPAGEVRQLIARLADDSLSDALVKSLGGDLIQSRNWNGVPPGWVTRPWSRRLLLNNLRACAAIWQESKHFPEPSYMAMKREDRQADERSRLLDIHDPGGLTATSALRCLTTKDTVLAQRRVLAIALAVRWYGLDHNGYPTSLDQLVPEYLPMIPVNPMSSTPFAYELIKAGRPDGGDRPVLYVDFGDGVPTHVTRLPEFELYQNRRGIQGQANDLIGWIPSQAEIDADDAERAKR